ncbi:MAG: anhydro-N-acetylmuramic acid kinase [Burkholderiales bacterium]|nr:anhydro-N-acetylmuramic acid kinase [Burkholderiales bacterium]
MMRVIGLMSGTSLDGIDVAIVDFEGTTEADLRWACKGFMSLPYAPRQRDAIHDVMVKGSTAALCALHGMLGEWFSEAVLQACTQYGVALDSVGLIGSHGQTIWHQPPQQAVRGFTLQLGCPATIAERTGRPVVSDFRTRDVAAGGQGAPLVPWVDRALFSAPGRKRALQNIGGMGNVTWLPPRGEAADLLAFDTGPGNVMIDAAVALATQGAEAYDRDGQWARRGTVRTDLLAELLQHPFYAAPPPKSTGREVFGQAMVADLAARPGLPWPDLIATLTALTAHTIARAYRGWLVPRGLDEVFVTGGGARNPVLMEAIRRELAPLPVRTGDELGVDGDAKEAVAFAALAWAHVNRVPCNVPAATGASGVRVLGSYTPA